MFWVGTIGVHEGGGGGGGGGGNDSGGDALAKEPVSPKGFVDDIRFVCLAQTSGQKRTEKIPRDNQGQKNLRWWQRTQPQ